MGHITWGVIIACGKDEQLSEGTDIGFLGMGNRPALAYSLRAMERSPEVDGVMVVARKERMDSVVSMVNLFGFTKVRKVVAGASSRKASLQSVLKNLDTDVSVICIHEASRPCLDVDVLSDVIKSAKRYGCGVAAARLIDPLRKVEKGLKMTGSEEPGKHWVLQKPQAFKRDLLEKGMASVVKKKVTFEDESDLAVMLNKPIHLVASAQTNLRIRGTDDLELATSFLSQRADL